MIRKKQKKKGLIFVISGPSGSGKTTLREKLLKGKKLKGLLVKSISFTTRLKRTGERQGRDYFFISEQEFKKRLKAKKIIEWTRYLGYYYATPKDFIGEQLAKGRNMVLCLDPLGAAAMKKLFPENTVTIFILPPSIKDLQERIIGRCCRTKAEEILKRMELAQQELLESRRYDYCVVNSDLKQAARELKNIVLKKLVCG